ncbi:subunit of tubulin prefoldin [Lecanicillium sp. MT-2017a]|nr:subunit of tubulin prefoldin [Lecanicillium sp. MT-2017a]
MAGPATSQTALPQEATTQLDSPRTAQCRPASENQVCEISQGELLNPKECANQDGPGPSVNLDTLEPQQLAQVKKQLDEELEHLTSSFGQLHGAQSKFKECLRCVNSRSKASPDSNSVLVPLTNSLYVRGELTNSDSVLVDVGTGFLVEKKLKSATTFYEKKVKEISENLKGLEGIIQQKQNNVRTIEEVLRAKILASQQQEQQGAQS